ncbi:MAG: HlyD family efflux transporter periplasmic adaptor subunit [Filifactoraceae bacterium]
MFNVVKGKLLKFTHGSRTYAVLVIFAILGLMLYGVSNVARGLYAVSIGTEQIVLGTMVNAAEKNAVIVRSETPIYAASSGMVSYVHVDGEKVKENTVVAEVRGSEMTDSDRCRLRVIDAKIKELSSNQNVAKTAEEELAIINQRLDYLYKDIQGKVWSDDLTKMKAIKDEVILLNDKKRFIEESGSGAVRSIESLQEEKKTIINNLESSNSRVVAPITGLVVSYADGYESELSIENMKNLNVSDLTKYKDKSVVDLKGLVKSGDPIGKIVSNDKWYIICEVDKKDIQSIVAETQMNIYIEDMKIIAYLEDFQKGKDGKFIGFFRVDTDGFKFYEKRNFPVRLEYKYSEGILVPKHAITKNSAGRIGVFVIDEANVVRFKLIENIISEDEENYICRNEKTDNGVSLYDKIISNPDRVKEGYKVMK